MAGRQLGLFGSSRQRGRRAPRPLEFAIHCMVADTLSRWANRDWQWTHLPFGENRDAITGARLQRMGTKPGWPDLILLAPREHHERRPHFLELKRDGSGPLKDEQGDFEQWCELHGCPHGVARSYQEAIAILQRWGVLRTSVEVT